MLDRTSRKFLDYLDSLPEDTLEYSAENKFLANFDGPSSFYAMIRHLESIGYVEIIKSQRGTSIGVRLSHIGLKRKEFRRLEILKYLEEKWIDMLALVVSLLALFISILSLILKTPEP